MIRFTLIVVVLCWTITAYSQSSPCSAEPYRQFDFWVGNWETTAGDKIAGTNQIIVLQDGCVIQENWTSAAGKYTGTSYNFYDPQDEQWHQTWIDNQGQSLRLSGGLNGKDMVLRSGEMKNAKKESVFHRITWTPNDDGSVRQHWESSADGKNDWTTLFDGLYKKKND